METNNLYWKRHALKITRLLWVATLTAPIPAIIICEFSHAPFADIGADLPLIGLRTVFYLVAILLFPLMRLFRHRLLIRTSDKHFSHQTLAQRYKNRVFVSLITAEFILSLGIILCLLGDHIFSFYLLAGLSWLAIILYRPRANELNELHA